MNDSRRTQNVVLSTDIERAVVDALSNVPLRDLAYGDEGAIVAVTIEGQVYQVVVRHLGRVDENGNVT